MKSAEFMDALKKKYGIKTDLRLGQILNISHSRIAMYRTGEREFDEDTCELVAIELDDPPATDSPASGTPRVTQIAIRIRICHIFFDCNYSERMLHHRVDQKRLCCLQLCIFLVSWQP